MTPKSEHTEDQPGADRFWGQFSQSKAGRTVGESESATEREQGREQASSGSEQCLDWCPICRSAELFRTTVSPELRQQAESIQHEAIGVLKAFLDAYADKANASETSSAGSGTADPRARDDDPPPPRVTDIPLS